MSPQARANPAFSLGRIFALVLRYWYLLRSSVPRMIELAYWPTVNMLLWGFMTQFLASQTSYIANAFGILLSGVLLWEILFRSQLGVSICFFEEIWSRNLGHLFVSPLRPYEMIAALGTMSFIRTVIGVLPCMVLATFLFGWSAGALGFSFGLFLALLLIMGWAIGFAICGMIMRYGQGMESLAWGLVFALTPLSGVYYPIGVLPGWLQPVAYALPTAHVFEGMRSILSHQVVRWDHLAWAAGLDLVYITLGTGMFLYCFRQARRRGLLLNQGE